MNTRIVTLRDLLIVLGMLKHDSEWLRFAVFRKLWEAFHRSILFRECDECGKYFWRHDEMCPYFTNTYLSYLELKSLCSVSS